MHAVRTPSRGTYDMYRGADGGVASGSSMGTSGVDGNRQGEPSSASLSPSIARLRGTAQQSASLGTGTASGNALRTRKSNAPDIGTPIKMASSSPYRTPESQSKAALFLSRTPFGTPAKAPTTGVVTHSSAMKLAGIDAPTKPATGFRAQGWALARSLMDDNAYVSFALQSRSHLSYTSALSFVLRSNWLKLSLTLFVALHAALSVASLRPLHPLQSITLPFQPVMVLLSILTFSLLIAATVLSSGHPFSLIDKRWEATQQESVIDSRVAGVTFVGGSPANLITKATRTKALWRGVFLYGLVGFAFAASHALSLIYLGAQGWTPYLNVHVRLSHGYRATAIRPNERFFFLLVSNSVLTGTYALARYLFSIRFAQGGLPAPFCEPRFEAQAIFERASTRLVKRCRSSVPKAAFFGLATPLVLLQAYLLVRRPIFRLLLSFIGYHSSIRSLIIPSFKKPLLSMDLVLRATTLAIATVVFLEIASSAWEVYATQPVSSTSGAISKFSREPTKSLTHAMQLRRGAVSAEDAHLSVIQRRYYAHFAFAEMATSVATDAERRKAIFRDIGNANTSSNGSQSGIHDQSGRSAWASIAQECMAVLHEQRGCIERKGRPAPNAGGNVPPAQQPNAHLKPVDAAHQITLASATDAIKTDKPSIWDRLASKSASTGATANAAATTRAATSTTTGAQANVEGLGSILHRIAPPQPQLRASPLSVKTTLSTSSTSATAAQPATVLDLVILSLSTVRNSISSLFGLLPSDLQHVLRNSFVARKGIALHSWLFNASDQTLLMANLVPNDAALATWAVQTLSALLSSSLDQDEYGTVALAASVNLGVDNVLEEFALLLLALQSWTQVVMHGDDSQASPRPLRNELTAHVDTTIAPLIATLRSSITLVTGAFEPTGLRLRETTRARVDQALRATKATE